MNTETVQLYARRVLYWLAGALASYGAFAPDAGWIEPFISFAVTLITFAWSLYGERLNGLLARVQGVDGVRSTNVTVDQSKISITAVNNGTPQGVTAK